MIQRRKHPLSAGLVSLVLTAAAVATCGGTPTAVAPAAPRAEEPACRVHTPAEWQAFLERYAGDPRWVKTCEDGGCDATFWKTVNDEIEGTLTRCAGEIAASPAIAACTANLRAFAPTWLRQHASTGYGFAMDNQAYFAHEEGPDTPKGMMRPPPDLIAAIPDVAKIEALARDHGWKYVLQDSCLGGARIFLLVPDPGGAFDDWMLLNLSGEPGKRMTVDVAKTMSFIGVQKKDAQGNPLPKVRLNFRDWLISAAPAGGYGVTPADSDTKCYACHASGTRQLISRRTPFLAAQPVRGEPGFGRDAAPDPAFAQRRLDELEARLRSYGLPDWNGTLDLPSFGPPIGEAQGCTECHDGSYRGVLSVMMSETQIEEKVHYELAMPPTKRLPALLERSEMKNPPLTPAEQKELDDAYAAHAKLAADVLGSRTETLRRWLLQTKCQ
jgi:hypothetical protein